MGDGSSKGFCIGRHGLVSSIGDGWLDWIILKVFSNLGYSVILWFCENIQNPDIHLFKILLIFSQINDFEYICFCSQSTASQIHSNFLFPTVLLSFFLSFLLLSFLHKNFTFGHWLTYCKEDICILHETLSPHSLIVINYLQSSLFFLLWSVVTRILGQFFKVKLILLVLLWNVVKMLRF